MILSVEEGVRKQASGLQEHKICVRPHIATCSYLVSAARLASEAKPGLMICYIFVDSIQGKRKVALPHTYHEAVLSEVSQTSVALESRGLWIG